MRENNNIETPDETKVYVRPAHYCPDNGQYEGCYTGSVNLGYLPRRVVKEVTSGDGGTVYIVRD